ncbi:MAG: hypothetical protein R3202_12805 [Candidatus Competibacterales bacterium]|nr:hypothetical protein [Candidatus Competibacterales bacterium]
MSIPRAVFAAALLLVIGSDALARIKLVTLPVRDRVAIRLDHPQATLVEEERVIPLVAGVNQVDFSWRNTRVDPDTLVFRVLPAAAEGAARDVRVLSVSYPPGEAALVWSVAAASSGPARVRISYLLGGLDKTDHYRASADPDERRLTLEHYTRIINQANESFDSALIWPGVGEPFERPLEQATTKELLLARYEGVAVVKTYTVDPAEHGWLDRSQDKLNVPMHYRLSNDAAHGLGRTPLPYGKARIFQRDGQGGSAFLGEDWAEYTPLEEDLELFLGLARDIVVRRTVLRNERRERTGPLHDIDVVLRYEIENFKDAAVRIDLVEHPRWIRDQLYGHRDHEPEWTLGPRTSLPEPPDPEATDQLRVTLPVPLPPRAGDTAPKHTYLLHLRFHNEW